MYPLNLPVSLTSTWQCAIVFTQSVFTQMKKLPQTTKTIESYGSALLKKKKKGILESCKIHDKNINNFIVFTISTTLLTTTKRKVKRSRGDFLQYSEKTLVSSLLSAIH